MNAWLIEYIEAQPCPVYVPADFERTNGQYTLDAWAARRFDSKEQAEEYMASVPYFAPWTAVQHGFDVRCDWCHKETGTWYTLCDDCIPF